MKSLFSFLLFAGACAVNAAPSMEPVVITRDGWSYDRIQVREPAEKVAELKAAAKPIWLTGWAEYDITVPKTGWYELWLGGCPPEWQRDVFVDGKTISRLQFSSGTDKLDPMPRKGIQFKELNVYLESGPHALRIQRLGFPGTLPGTIELRSSDGGAASSVRVVVDRSRFGSPGSSMEVTVLGGGTSADSSYDLYWKNEATDATRPAVRVAFSSGAKMEAKPVTLKLPEEEGLYSLQAKVDGEWLRPSDLKAGFFLSANPKTSSAPAAPDFSFQLAAPFADGVVLQREKPLPVWGWSQPGDAVTVTLAGQTIKTVADANGRWQAVFKPLKSGGEPLELKAQSSSGQSLVCKDVQVGEVWVLSGQSNMGGPLLQSTGGPELAATANSPQVRLLLAAEGQPAGSGAKRLARMGWLKAVADGNPKKNLAKWNAIPFAFGHDISTALNVPVGLVSANRGGTYISTWISPEVGEKDPSLRPIIDTFAQEEKEHIPELLHMIKLSGQIQKWRKECEQAVAAGKPAPAAPVLAADLRPSNDFGQNYTGLIEPLGALAIRGVLWYQGESDSSMADAYRYRFPLMIRNWRTLWGDPDLPFLFVQIAYGKGDLYTGEPAENRGAELKQTQLETLSVPHTAMVVTDDLMVPGDNVHYLDKLPVGHRLANAALAKVYGKDVPYSGPVYKAQRIEGSKIRLTFDFAKEGLATRGGGKLGGFIIAGEDRKWFQADAEIDGATVVVSSPRVPRPVAVRYSWAEQPSGGNLINKAGLPSPVFRTDNWPMITSGVLWEQKN
jgi:sialate O-acetylesterase